MAGPRGAPSATRPVRRGCGRFRRSRGVRPFGPTRPEGVIQVDLAQPVSPCQGARVQAPMNDVGPPPHGRGMPWRDVTCVAVDLELTGLDPRRRRDRVLRRGTDPTGRVVLSEAVYREVEPSIPSSAAALSVHHLRAQDLAGNHDIHHEKASLAQALQGRFIVAWAAEIEDHLPPEAVRRNRASLAPPHDRRPRARLLDGGSRREPTSWRDALSAADRYCVPPEAAHDAMGAAITTAQLYLVLAHRASTSRGHPIAVRRLLRMGRRRS